MTFIVLMLLVNVTSSLQADGFITTLKNWFAKKQSTSAQPTLPVKNNETYYDIQQFLQKYSLSRKEEQSPSDQTISQISVKQKKQPSWHDTMHTNVMTFNVFYFASCYIDLALKKEKFVKSTNTVCTMQKNMYEEWFLNKEGFFLACFSKIKALKNVYCAEGTINNVLGYIAFAQNSVVPDLAESFNAIVTEFKNEPKTVREMQTAAEDTQSNINNQIKQKKQKVQSLEQGISTLENDVQKFKTQNEQLTKDAQQLEAIRQKDLQKKALEDQFAEQINEKNQLITKKATEINQENKKIQNVNEKIKNIEDFKKLYQRLLNYNQQKKEELEKKPLAEQAIAFLQNVLDLDNKDSESEELKKEREAILNKINKWKNPAEKVDGDLLFTQELLDIVNQLQNKELLENKLTEHQTALAKLTTERDTLQKEQESLKKKQLESEKQLIDFKNQLTNQQWLQDQNPAESIKNSITNNNNKISLAEKTITDNKEKIKVLTEEISELEHTTSQETLDNFVKEEIEKQKKQKKAALQNIDMTDAVKQYVTQLISFFSKQQESTSMLYVPNALTLLLYDLSLILTIPVLHTGQKVVVQKEQADVPAQNISCVFDDSLINPIQAKIVALKEDVQAMLNHTLTLAQSAQNDYKKCIAINDLLFMPLCKAYEQLELITKPWLEGYDQPQDIAMTFDLNALQEQYSSLLSPKQQLHAAAIIDNKDTLLVANLFFKQVHSLLAEKIQYLVAESPGTSDAAWFVEQFQKINDYHYALKAVQSMQIRWYNNMQKIEALFNDLQTNLLVDQKVKLVKVVVAPVYKTTDIFLQIRNKKEALVLNNNILTGTLPTIIQRTLEMKKCLIKLRYLFPEQSTVRTTDAIASLIKDQFDNGMTLILSLSNQNTIISEIYTPLMIEVKNELNTILKKVPKVFSSTNPFVKTNPFDE